MPTRYAGTPQERAVLDAYIKLWRAAHSVEFQANRHLSEYRLTVSQFGVLESLYHLGPLSQRQIARKILRSSGNLTLVVDNLERDGHVVRTRDHRDRRVMTVSLTEQGRQLVSSVLPRHIGEITRAFGGLSADELDQLSGLCRKLGLSLQD